MNANIARVNRFAGGAYGLLTRLWQVILLE
jgi:hypothetical protein